MLTLTKGQSNLYDICIDHGIDAIDRTVLYKDRIYSLYSNGNIVEKSKPNEGMVEFMARLGWITIHKCEDKPLSEYSNKSNIVITIFA